MSNFIKNEQLTFFLQVEKYGASVFFNKSTSLMKFSILYIGLSLLYILVNEGRDKFDNLVTIRQRHPWVSMMPYFSIYIYIFNYMVHESQMWNGII